MDKRPLTTDHTSLIQHAEETCERSFDPDFFDGAHVVAAAVRTADGTVYDGVSLPTNIGRASLCAEPIAVGSAIADGRSHHAIETCVAVSYPAPDHDAHEISVVPPCGACRELLADYNPELDVVVPVDGEPHAVRAIDLLPTRTW